MVACCVWGFQEVVVGIGATRGGCSGVMGQLKQRSWSWPCPLFGITALVGELKLVLLVCGIRLVSVVQSSCF